LELNEEIVSLRDKIDTGKLTAADYKDGTFSVSSVGNLGGRYFVPTVLPPQASIVAIGQAHKIAKYHEDSKNPDGYVFKPADVINYSLSADHRIIDGATAARYAISMKKYIENPTLMLLNMS
jgi:2-oxoisovalerate dehydrogenase E2 component (dihydrolipoyl transacylase)